MDVKNANNQTGNAKIGMELTIQPESVDPKSFAVMDFCSAFRELSSKCPIKPVCKSAETFLDIKNSFVVLQMAICLVLPMNDRKGPLLKIFERDPFSVLDDLQGTPHEVREARQLFSKVLGSKEGAPFGRPTEPEEWKKAVRFAKIATEKLEALGFGHVIREITTRLAEEGHLPPCPHFKQSAGTVAPAAG